MDNQQVQEAEIVEEEVSVSSEDVNSQTTVLLSLENMIKRHIATIEKLQEETKKHKEMFDGEFEGSETFKALSEKFKETQKARNSTREQILKQPNMSVLADKLKQMRQEMKELRSALSDYLLEYQRLSGLTEIQGEDGEYRQIVHSAKAVKKSAKSSR